MSSKRRSTRERAVPAKYFKESSSEDEGDDDRTKAAKLKLKELMNDDSDQESDFEKQIPNNPITSSDSDLSEVSDNEIKTPKRSKGEKSICLSESDSDSGCEDQNVFNKNKISSAQYQQLFNSQARNPESPDDDEANDIDANNLKLLALAGNLQKQEPMWEETEENSEKKSKTKVKVEEKPKKAAKKRKSNDCFETVKKPKPSSSLATANSDSISKLLAMGEGVDMENVEAAGADDDDEEKAPILPKSGVEVTVPVPEHLRRRKKKEKKEFDVESFLKRELSRAKRELLLLQHRAGLVFQLGHLLHLHHCLSCPSLQCQALSLVPTSQTFAPASLTLTRLGQFLTWLRETFPVSRHQVEARSVAVVAGLETSLSTLLVMSDLQLVLVFVLTCRALGYRVRLVLNLATPTKEDSSEEGSKEKQSQKKPREESPPGDRDEAGVKKKKKKPEPEKPKLSSKLAAAVSSRKSKRLPPSVTEERIVANIEEKSDRTEAEEKKDKRKSRKKVGESSKESGYFPSKSKQSGSGKAGGSELRYWAEVFLARENRWIPVDVITGKVNNAADIESRASKPVLYVFGVNNQGGVKDVTRRYSGSYLTQTRKLRTDQTWVAATLSPWLDRDNAREDDELARKSEEAPLPTNIGAFKGHPLYALQRHLLKFEAIYPPDAPTLGFIRGEGVYARECVHTLQGRTSWLKEGRVVRLGEEPYKVVKARPKWDRMTGAKTTEEPLEVFGAWQTEIYIPPVAVGGKVPRNEYGNVELFKPWMLPGGCVHIPINGMQSAIRKSGIDAAAAMVGWDFSGCGAHPVFDGFVVCQENAEALMDAWNQEQEIKQRREQEKKEKRVLDNWKRLVKGLMFREKMRSKYIDGK